jgi:L-malate glycosyltransferase
MDCHPPHDVLERPPGTTLKGFGVSPLHAPRRGRGRGRAGPLRVCFMIDRLGVGGTELQLAALLHHIDRTRVEPYLCLLRSHDHPPWVLDLEPNRVLCLEVGSLHSLASLRKALRFVRFLQRERIDVLQMFFPDCTYFGVPAARLAGVPRLVRTRNNLGYWMSPKDRWLGWLFNRFIDATVANSKACWRAVTDDERPAAGSVVVLENGIDADRFTASFAGRTGPRSGPGRSVGMVANMRDPKNPDVFVRAAKIVAEAHPDATFRIAGEGPMRPLVEQMIAELGLEGRFTLCGQIEDVPSFLAETEVAVLCSSSEGMSNALLEYMAAGCAIVATSVGGNVELIIDGVSGLLVPPGDAGRLAAAIDHHLRDTAAARRMGAAARQVVLERFSHVSRARRFEAFYGELVAGPFPPRGPGLMLRTRVKCAVAAAATGSGLVRLRNHLAGRRHLILTFHRVRPAGVPADEFDTCPSVDADQFRDILRFVKARYRVMPLRDLCRDRVSSEPMAAVTFDDGWRDNHDMALPVLRELGVPATIFVATGKIGATEAFWQQHLGELFRRCAADDGGRLGTRLRSTLRLAPGTALDRSCYIATVARWKSRTLEECQAALETLVGQAPGRESPARQFMNCEELRELTSAGIALGSHGVSHRILTVEGADTVAHELTESRRALEAITGTTVDMIAYPNGSYSGPVIKMARDAGFAVGCTTDYGLVRPGDEPLSLPRVDVGWDRFLDHRGQFSGSLLLVAGLN